MEPEANVGRSGGPPIRGGPANQVNAEKEGFYLCQAVKVGGRNNASTRGGGATAEGFYIKKDATVGEVIQEFRKNGASYWMTDSQLAHKLGINLSAPLPKEDLQKLPPIKSSSKQDYQTYGPAQHVYGKNPYGNNADLPKEETDKCAEDYGFRGGWFEFQVLAFGARD